MTNEATINKLLEMRLTTMADAYRRQLQEHSLDNFSFEERLGLLVDIEYTSRKNNRLKRLIHSAGFDQSYACIADINYSAGRKLDKSQIERLASCQYIAEKHNIIIMGASGAGKSYLSCAFGIEACKQYYTVKYIRLPELLADLAVARGEGIYKRVINQYRKVNLLILDEWMLVSLTETESRDLLEIIHARHKRASTVFCSQFSPAGWHGKIGETTLADAILDRIVHDSYTIEIHGSESDRSMREVYGIQNK
ncbi:MAG TPA: IS21-like element helper ATPase IstB [Bacillota bacterium]|nr:IS21-like element helper ATPase IstB [Bacillota bacterium]